MNNIILYPIYNSDGIKVDQTTEFKMTDYMISNNLNFKDEDIINNLIQEVSELVELKYYLVDSVVLGSKKSLAGVYNRKYQKALNNDFSDEVNALIIANHKKQLEFSDRYLIMIDDAYQGVMALIDSKQFDRAKQAIQAFRLFGKDTTSSDIINVVSA